MLKDAERVLDTSFADTYHDPRSAPFTRRLAHGPGSRASSPVPRRRARLLLATERQCSLASLWLIPPGDLYAQLFGMVSALSDRFSTPRFQPHVTFLSSLPGSEDEIWSRSAQLAAILRPFDVYLTTLGYADDYFRALFITAAQTEPLMEAHSIAGRIFNQPSDEPYQPHLSLLYGQLADSVKEAIIAEIGRDFQRTFPVTRLYLVSTEGEPAEWHTLEEFPIGLGPIAPDASSGAGERP